MDESDFIGRITGEVRWATDDGCCYFHPHDLPYDWLCSRGSMSKITEASVELARLDGMLRFVNPEVVDILVKNLSLRESVSSSSIEGIMSTVDDILRSEKDRMADGPKDANGREVENYRRALLLGFDRLQVGGKITVELIRELHRVLMDGIRGSDRSSGEFRTCWNAIGRPGDTLENAKMVPASPESVDFLLDNWLEYVNSEDVDTVEKIALSHYQFEVIHPFRDGNGRLGRLLIMMILRRDGLLTLPILHLSGYLNLNRGRYMDLLYKVSTEDALDEWLGFLADGLREQSGSTIATVDSLIHYRDMLMERAVDINESRTIEMLFRNPYVNSHDLVDGLGISQPTANKILNRLVSEGVLREVTGRKRNRLYLADGIMQLLR